LLNSSIFSPVQINEVSTPDCLPNYYVFQTSAPYLPIQSEKTEATCLLNDDSITASWNITKHCEPSCSIRECDNGQTCGLKDGVLRCICAIGYVGKYCEYRNGLLFIIYDLNFFFFNSFYWT